MKDFLSLQVLTGTPQADKGGGKSGCLNPGSATASRLVLDKVSSLIQTFVSSSVIK